LKPGGATLLFLLTIAGAAVGGPPQTEAPPAFFFVDVAAEAGLHTPTWCGRPEKPHILESNGTGLALLDYDGDGDLDLYLVNGWRLAGPTVTERGRNVLYRNRGDGTFDDVTERAAVGDHGWGSGAGVGDADADGDPDLFVANFGPDVLYLNAGDGTFVSLPEPPSLDGWSTGAVFFDADGDADLDLYVGGYIDCTLEEVLHAEPELTWQGMQVMLGPFGLEGEGNRYFENLGDGRFRDATEDAGLVDVGLYYSFGIAALDLDDDGHLDLYVANDSNPNYLYRNNGKGHFQEMGLWSGAALDEGGMAQAGMGFAAGDIDGDSDLDLFVTNFSQDTSTMYLNLGDFIFEDITRRLGIREVTYMPLSWGATLSDLDLDGDLDLFLANGHIYPQADLAREAGFSYGQANLILARQGDHFENVSQRAGPGLAVTESSRGVAVGDLDGDGDLDLAIANVDVPPTLLRNDTPRRGSWLLVDAPEAARVVLEAGGQRLTRHRVVGGSFLSASDQRLHFGLGTADDVDRLLVSWSDGTQMVLRDLEVNRVLRIRR
jgi:hypothetical protein